MFPLCKVHRSLHIRSKCIRLIIHSFKNRACRYADPGDQPSSDISRDVNQLDGLSQKTCFPSVYFLDRDVFRQSLVEIPNPSLPLSLQLNIFLGNDSEIRHIASRFFDRIHPFMPIISKQLFYTRHLNPLAPPKSDVLLLCFCMKIFTWMPSEKISDPQTHDYLSEKHSSLKLRLPVALRFKSCKQTCWLLFTNSATGYIHQQILQLEHAQLVGSHWILREN